MQQIENFYNFLYPKNIEGYKTVWYGEINSPPILNKWFKNNNDLCKFINSLDKTKFNIYHACAIFNTEKRRRENAIGAKALWIDVDFNNFENEDVKLSEKEIYTKAINQLDLLKTTIFSDWNVVVFTGRGLHIYWIFDELLNVEEWQTFANELETTLNDINFIHDSARTRDIASLMRAPETTNLKNNKSTTIIIQKDIIVKKDFDFKFQNKIKELKPKLLSVSKNLDVDASLLELNNNIKSNVNEIAKNCAFINQFKNTGFAGNEPAWRMALAIVRCCIDGETIAHEWSSKDVKYNSAETQSQLDDLRNRNIGATTCKVCENFGFCKNCKYKNKLNSALKLGLILTEVNLQTIVSEETKIADRDILNRVQLLASHYPTGDQGWIVGKEGIYKIVEDIPTLVCNIPFFIIDIINDDFDDTTITTILIRSYRNNKAETFKLPLKYLEDSKKLISEFNSRRIFPQNKPLLKQYISVYMQRLWFVEAQKSINSLGWIDDISFIYTQSGDGLNSKCEEIKYTLDSKMRGYADGFNSKGSLKNWLETANTLCNNPDLYPHFFSLLCSMGAPFLMFTSAKGFLLSLYGKSGGGKTLAHKFAMSVWGHPDIAGCIGVYDTARARMGRMAVAKNMPLRLDEATVLKKYDLAGLIFELVNGRGRSRATKEGALSNVAVEWQTVTLVTTNSPILEKDTNTISEAERCRLLEIEVENVTNYVKTFTLIGENMSKSYGLIGIEIIKYFISHKQSMLDFLYQIQEKLRALVDEDKRFWVACGAIALTAAKIVTELDYFKIDIEALIKWFSAQMTLQRDVVKRSLIDARGYETKEEFIQALYDSLHGSLLILNDMDQEVETPRNEILGRLKKTEHNDILYVTPKVVQKFVADRDSNISYRSLLNKFGIKPAETMRIAGSQGRFYIFEIVK